MIYVLAAVAVVAVVVTVWGTLTGRLRATGCCAVADPAKDLRMRAAFENPQPSRMTDAEATRTSVSPAAHAADTSRASCE